MTNDTLDLKSEMMNQVDCKHDWIRGKGDYNIKCSFCIYYPSQDNRATCSVCFKQACIECLKSKNYNWRMEVELESEEKILASRVRTLENRMNKFEVEFEELKNKVEYNNIKQKGVVIENNEQMITIKDHKGDKLIQLKDAITSFGSKYIVKFPFKDILGIRIPIKIVLKPNISYKLLALDTGCTKNIIHDKYFARCPELVTTIDDDKAEVSTDMSETKKLHNQIAYNIDTYINGTKYVIDEVTIKDLSLINDDMIIGLRFLQYSTSGLILTEQGIAFIPYHDSVPYISKVQKIRKSPQCLQIKDEESEDSEILELGDNIEHAVLKTIIENVLGYNLLHQTGIER